MKRFRSLEELTCPSSLRATAVEERRFASLGKIPLVDRFALRLRSAGIPEPVRELRFHGTRKWRFDLAWPSWKLAVEVDGGTYGASRASGHTSISGMARDREKDAEAQILGWSVIRVDARAVEGKRGPDGVDWVQRWIKERSL